jgi:hypothetical protein
MNHEEHMMYKTELWIFFSIKISFVFLEYQKCMYLFSMCSCMLWKSAWSIHSLFLGFNTRFINLSSSYSIGNQIFQIEKKINDVFLGTSTWICTRKILTWSTNSFSECSSRYASIGILSNGIAESNETRN